MINFRLYLIVTLTILVTLMLSALPLPRIATAIWPDWTVLAVIYWCLALPNQLNIKFAWLVGIIVDLVNGTIIGQHALIYTWVAYITILLHSRLRIYPIFQQSLGIGILLLPYLIIFLWIEGMLYSIELHWQKFMPLLSSIILWPWIFSVLRSIRHKVHIKN